MEKKNQDIKEVMIEDGRRGRRPIDLKSQSERKEKLATLRKLLEIGTEADFVKAMRAVGLHEGSQAFAAALEAWREFWP